MARIIKGVKYYPVSERIRFGLESMREHARYMVECEFPDGNISLEDCEMWEDLADECEKLMDKGSWLCWKDYSRAKEITIDREFIRYHRCLAAGMSERDAGQALGNF